MKELLENSRVQDTATQNITATVVGDVRVGKTTLIHKACRIAINGKLMPTIGVEFAATNLQHKNRNFRIKFWDLSGQNKFRNLFQKYAQRSNFIIVVFDITNYESYHNAKQWVLEIRDKYEDIPILLFGNKRDLYDKNPDTITNVQPKVVRDFIEKTNVIYDCGCALSDDRLIEGIKKVLERNFIPNEVILQGINQSKHCGCFC